MSSPLFWRQDSVLSALTRAKDRDRLARSYLFTGPEGVGKWAAAQWLTNVLLCEQTDMAARPCGACGGCRRAGQGIHADWHALFPVPRATADEDRTAYLQTKRENPFAVVRFTKRPNLSIGSVRELIGELSKTAVEGGAKVSVIACADQMAGDAQTILLKSIEEPPPETYFILTNSDPGRILPTVRSRCQVIRFAPVHADAIAARLVDEDFTDPADAEIVAELCGGGWGNAVRLADAKLSAWRRTVASFWNTAFALKPVEMVDRIEADFRGKSFEDALQAFDIWGLLLRRGSTPAAQTDARIATPAGLPIDNPETAWACWRILQNGRATLWVNVIPRSAVKGTFLMLRRRLGFP